MMAKAVILLSGGLDSATCMAVAKSEGFDLYALTFDYGQRHKVEIERARLLATAFKAARHVVLPLDLSVWGGSALVCGDPVPKGRTEKEMSAAIPPTYVPARNTVFLSLALAFAEAAEAADIFIGVNSIDYSGYPDCRPEFIRQFENLANVATKKGISGGCFRIHTPLIDLSKADIVRLAHKLGLDFSLTHSCYDPNSQGRPCGECDSCLLRKNGFLKAGIEDTAQTPFL